MSKVPIIEGTFLLERMPGKGGWTYLKLPGVSSDYRGKFGSVKVSGTIDDYELVNYGLMPIRNGGLFLPIKAEIRKKTGKKEGDNVYITLYADAENLPMATPEDLLLCLQDEPEAYQAYQSCTETERKAFLDWIGEANQDEIRVKRIVQTIDMLLNK
ncbi:YdeI/OmpD-associated family protein [Pedobacter metabolipauper]|uniref:Bacteriocin resistance YdeI/OmpD-like protein n=1 Tax=Pedobacter metabolipauper TaxID=425513 RepID=A0A4R6SSG8_9SPHI|nr:YdeI/OmpD-associated family protein [Pedobacter metabolipauper]TDQ07488.1 bacteriocin resistance YdeI/OmpD-like protein [Pedobacter metabolipauper]